MFIIEFIIKKLTGKKEKPEYNPLQDNSISKGQSDYEVCEHTFMPIDSTNETLSCTKCGILAKRSELRDMNFFNQSKSDLN